LAKQSWKKRGVLRLQKALESSGLYSDEARYVAQIWEKEFFKTDGIRAFYIIPQEKYDQLYKLTLSKKPDAIKRVMIVALEQ